MPLRKTNHLAASELDTKVNSCSKAGHILRIFYCCISIILGMQLNTGFGQTSIPSTTPVIQNFDGMAATTTAPVNWRMHQSATPSYASGTGTLSAQASSGSPTAGGTYNWGAGASERAMGAMTSGSFASPNSVMGFFRNTNALALNSLTISYDLERYRINAASASVQFFYSTNGSSWTSVLAGDIATASLPTGTSAYSFAPAGVPTATNAGVINKTGISITGLNIATNGDIYLRWNLNTTGSNSQGIGIDNVSVTAAFAATASISPTPASLTGFTYAEGSGPSSPQTFTLSASNLTAGGGTITMDASATNYEVSTTSPGTTGFGTSANLTYTGTGALAANTVWVQLKSGLTTGTYNGQTINISGGGANASVTVSGNVTLANDLCTGAIAIPCGGSVIVDNTNATDDALPSSTISCPPSTNGLTKGIWFKVTPADPGSVTVFTCGTSTNIDTYLRVYSGVCGSFTACKGVNDDASPSCANGVLLSSLTFSATANTTYYVLCGLFNSTITPGSITISATCPLPTCAAPTSPASNIVFTSVTANSIDGTFDKAVTEPTGGYLVIQSISSTLSSNPQDRTAYAVNSSVGGGTVIANITPTGAASYPFSASPLLPNTTYYYFIIPYNYQNGTCEYGYGNAAAISSSTSTCAVVSPPTGLSDQSICGDGNVTFSVNDPGAGFTVEWSTDGINNDDGTGLTKSKPVTAGSPITEYARISNSTGCKSEWVSATGTANTFSVYTTVFSESVGTPGSNTLINSYTGWQNNGTLTFSSTDGVTDVRTTSPSTGSGSGNVFMGIATTTNRNFQISGINTIGLTSLVLSFGLLRDNTTNGLTVEVSSNGTLYTPLSITQPTSANTWTLVTASGTIPAASNLRIRFSKNNSTSFRIDDINLVGASVSAAISQTNTCVGTATLTASIGSSYLWFPGGETTNFITISSSGSYSVTVSDANGCTSAASLTVTAPTVLTASVSAQTNVTCYGGSNGSVTITASGGTSPYTGDGVHSGLSAGTISFTVTDVNGCTATTSAIITQPNAVSLTETHQHVSCNGGNNGSIDLTVSGGNAPYSYSWNNGAYTTEDLSNLIGGTYTVTVTTADGCMASTSVQITQPAALLLSETHVNVVCNGASTGSVDLTVTGGASPYSYSWNNGAYITEDLTGVPAGTYQVTVTDANNCVASTSITITQQPPIMLSETHTNVYCEGDNNGAIDLTVVGSAQPGIFNESFNTLASSGTSSSVPSGWAFNESGSNANSTYTAGTGSSATGDTYSFGAATASERALGGLLSGSLTPFIGAFFTNNTGVTVTSVSISYYGEQWRLGNTGRTDKMDFQYSTDATSLITGTWVDADALDFNAPNSTGTTGALDGNAAANRVFISGTITGLSIPNGTTLWIGWRDFNATGADDGLAIDDFSATLNVPTYTYSWSNNAITEDISSLTAGTYTVTVTDANNCTTTAAVAITVIFNCHDNNPCTTDVCSQTGCTNTAVADGSPGISDGLICTDDVCLSGNTVYNAIATDDSNPCTDDACDETNGITHTAVADGSPGASDGLVCTDDVCLGGSTVHNAVATDDGNSCTDDACDETNGVTHTALTNSGGGASDGLICTDDNCDDGQTVHPATNVDDSNPCTFDACDETNGVTHESRYGCTDIFALNYDPSALCDNGTCIYPCMNPTSISSNDADNIICPGDYVVLTAVGGSLTSGSAFNWYSGSCGGTFVGTGTLISVSPATSSTYFVKAEGTGCGNPNCVSLSITVSANPAATIIPAGSVTVCQGAPLTLTANAGSGLTYQWYTGSTPLSGETAQTLALNTSALPLNSPLSYRVRVTNAAGCFANSAFTNVTVRPTPNANFTPTGTITLCAGATQLLTGTLASATTYQWSRNGGSVGGNTSNLMVYQNGTYALSVTNSYGCTATSASSATVTFTGSGATLIANAGANQNLCENNATLGGNIPPLGITGTWTLVSGSGTITDVNSATSTVTGLSAGQNKFSWRMSDGTCMGTADEVILHYLSGSSPVVITAGGPVNFCSPGTVTFTANVCGTGWTFQWQMNGANMSGKTAQTLTVSTSIATYRVRATKSAVSYYSNTISVNTTPTIIVNGSASICPPNVTTMLELSNAGVSYQWYKNSVVISGATGATHIASAAGNYTCRIYYNSTCYQTTPVKSITALPNCSSKQEQIPLLEAIKFVDMKAFPNPFSDKLSIEFALSEDSRVQLEIFNLAGQSIAELFEGNVIANELQKFEFTPEENVDGMIIYRLQTEKGAVFGKAVMVR